MGLGQGGNRASEWRQTVTDDEIRAAAHIACCSLVYRAIEQLAIPLQNLALELQGEKSPFKRGARSHAQTCTGILKSVKELYNAKLKFRQFLGSSRNADRLLRRLPKLLKQLEKRVFQPLRNAATRGTENSARQTIQRVCRVADRLSVAANREAERAIRLLGDAVARLSPPPSRTIVPPAQALPPRQSAMTVVSVDLSEYGRLSAMLEEVADVQTLLQFNQTLQAFFRDKVISVGADPNQIPAINTGDGALMFFSRPTQAVQFALAVQRDAIDSNLRVKDHRNKKRYRIGLCTGEVCLQETRAANNSLLSFSAAGVAIARAVRLQAKCELDQLLLCEDTYVQLTQMHRRRCRDVEQVEGKSHETWKISARRYIP
jgi:class 3 adenylate cyclase